MRWKQPKVGERRTRAGFLWWPRKINRITRWLERAKWEERVIRYDFTTRWRPERWLDIDDGYVDVSVVLQKMAERWNKERV